MPGESYRFDRFELQPAERRLLVDGAPAVLGARAFDLLLALVERRGRTVSKAELIDLVWPDTVVEENNLAVHVSQLRKALGGDCIATVAGRGYQFTRDLLAAAAPAAPPPAATGLPPAPSTRLIGREAELDRLATLLQECRLVTLAGPGGIGKTRLALGWCEGPGRGRRVAWIDMANLADAALLPQALTGALGLAAGDRPADAQLRDALARDRWTLVLDNAEPIAAGAAEHARAWLDAAPGLTLLVTSQVPLRLPSEQVLRLGALSLPEGRVTPQQALAHGAVQLFVERVRAVDPAFELVPGNVTSVVEICSRLDGVPLALELAAARAPLLGVTALAAALDQRLRVVGDPLRSAPARQRTLRAALEWSHGLLDAQAQRVFRRLGVFAGGFMLEAAQAVVADAGPAPALDGWAVAATLGRLVEDSLVTRDGQDPPRFGLLESARLFALDMLENSGEAPALQRRHLAWCTAFASATIGALPLDDARTRRVAAEYANLRAALERALGSGTDAEGRAAGAALAVVLVPYWDRTDGADASGERRRWLVAPAPGAPPERAPEDTAARLLQHLQADGLAASGIDPQTVIALARRLGSDDVRHFDGALKELERAVDIASRVLAGAPGGDAEHDAFVADVLAGVAGQTRRGRFDDATDAVDDALAEIDRREARRQAALRRSRQALLEAGIQQDMLRRDAFAVARRIEALAALEAPQAPTQSALYLAREAAAFAHGREQGSALSLAVAVELARRRLALAADVPSRRDAVRSLGAALVERGLQLSADADFIEAQALLRAALADGGAAPADRWRAGALHLLARALHHHAARQGDAAAQEEALRLVLEELDLRPRDQDEQAYADAQLLRSQVSIALGMRETGWQRLAEAADALRESLKVWTRSRAPEPWARVHVQLGIVLSELARRQGDATLHDEAAASYRLALLETDRADQPKRWAALQNNLGIELSALGEHDAGPETLQSAVDAYRQALREWTPDSQPTGWAAVQHNLGGALRLLGERESGTQSLREAGVAFGEALKVHTRERAPLRWAAGQNDLALVLLALGRREGDERVLAQAVQAFDDALLERRRDAAPLDWASTQVDRGLALWALGETRRDAGAVRAALAAAEQALEVLAGALRPDVQATAQRVAAQARHWLAGAGRDSDR